MKQNLKFIIKSERMISEEDKEKLRTQLEAFKNGENEAIVINNAITVAVLNDKNKILAIL
ncbi:hypothetical protein [Lachnoclostridium sp.]|uniref:hypothetical protein n=1 Tax=Lachnoclostridium sp. TaxID=2028282 RepID=UPI00289A2614|nr:hypothetical protein [Lachnoclostridium sp.]